MGSSSEIIKEMEKCFREKLFDSKDSLIRIVNEYYLLEWKSGDVTLKAEIAEEDTIGLLLAGLIVERDIQENQNPLEYLRAAAEAIEKKITYLMEPLKLVELDSTSNAMQIRSEKPEIVEGGISYFECILKSGRWFGYRNSLVFRRYSQRPSEEKDRRITPFPLTKKQFGRLIDDLIEIL